MKIYLIRHGKSTGDLENRYGGKYDDPLSSQGVLQAKKLAKEFSEKNLMKIFHIPYLRAKKVAQILGENLNVNLKEVDNLRERNNYGILGGLTKSEAKVFHPTEVKNFDKNGFFNIQLQVQKHIQSSKSV